MSRTTLLPPREKNFQQATQAALATREPTDERPVLLMAQDEGCGCPASASPDELGLRRAFDHTPHVKSFATIRLCMLLWLPQRAK